jgi:hypothetical protein
MCNNYFETEEYKDYTIKIMPDNDPMNPRTDFDNLATIVCVNHRRYNLGDVQTSEISEYLQEQNIAVCLPVYMYEHGNIALSTGNQYPFNDLWDSGCIGAIFVTRETVLKEYGWKKITPERKAKLVQYLKNEVGCYSDYLSGNVYGYEITDENGEELDSCWGFYGYDDCLTEAKSQVNYYASEVQKEDELLDNRIKEYA